MVAPLAMLGLSLGSSLVQGIAGAASGSSGQARTAKAKATATDFESMFLENALDRLTQDTGADGPLGENGEAGGIYKSMLAKEYAGSVVRSGGVGIADAVFRQMMRMQEVGNGGA